MRRWSSFSLSVERSTVNHLDSGLTNTLHNNENDAKEERESAWSLSAVYDDGCWESWLPPPRRARLPFAAEAKRDVCV